MTPNGVERVPRRLALRVTKDAARQIRSGHPWVFEGSVTSVRPEGQAGDLAVIFDDRRDFMAIGLYDPRSPIRVKVLHHGRPERIDGSFWLERLSAAQERRSGRFDLRRTNGFRLVNGENDGLPAMVVDRYGEVGVLKLYSEAWLPHLDDLVAAIAEVFSLPSLVLRLSRSIQRSLGSDAGPLDGTMLAGEPPEGPIRFVENGLRFEADVVAGQKTGFFLDQRDNRSRVRSRSQGRRVLDVYSCSGGFSVAAAAGAAKLVHSVDISRGAIDAAVRNMALNRSRPAVRACSHHTSVGDAFEVMAQMRDAGRSFDMVIVDPPSFASKQSHVDRALKSYGRLTAAACHLLGPGGLLVQASCSARVEEVDFQRVVLASATEAGFDLGDVTFTDHGVDHPVSFPQGNYLKAIFATVARRSR